MFAKIENGIVSVYPYAWADLVLANPSVSFPNTQSEAVANSFGLVLVHETTDPAPAHNPVTHLAGKVAIYQNGYCTEQWEVAPKFVEYTDDHGTVHTVSEQESVAIAADAAEKIRALQSEIVNRTQARLDEFAKTRSYDGILSACTYATSTIPKFFTESQYCVNQRDATWAMLYTIMAEVASGTRPMPTGYADVEPLLPALVWPA